MDSGTIRPYKQFSCDPEAISACYCGEKKYENNLMMLICPEGHTKIFSRDFINRQIVAPTTTTTNSSEKIFHLNMPLVPYTSVENNISQNLTLEGTNILRYPIYSQMLPSIIRYRMPVFSAATNSLLINLMENEPYLPLRVGPAFQRGRSIGKGVFATRDIPKNHIVSVYVGMIRPSYSDAKNNCLFHVGPCLPQNLPQDLPQDQAQDPFTFSLYIDPVKNGNGARFINSSQSPNLDSEMGLFQKDGKHFPVIVLSSKKKIKAGQQLRYDYGQDYDISESSEEEEEEEYDDAQERKKQARKKPQKRQKK